MDDIQDYKIFVSMLYGDESEVLTDASRKQAIEYIKKAPVKTSKELTLVRIELVIKQENDLKGEWQFHTKEKAIYFIENIHKAL